MRRGSWGTGLLLGCTRTGRKSLPGCRSGWQQLSARDCDGLCWSALFSNHAPVATKYCEIAHQMGHVLKDWGKCMGPVGLGTAVHASCGGQQLPTVSDGHVWGQLQPLGWVNPGRAWQWEPHISYNHAACRFLRWHSCVCCTCMETPLCH